MISGFQADMNSSLVPNKELWQRQRMNEDHEHPDGVMEKTPGGKERGEKYRLEGIKRFLTRGAKEV